jgi:adenylate cyclase
MLQRLYIQDEEQDLTFDSFERIDYSGRNLKTIPLSMYPHADLLVSLDISRNPSVEIPLDFVQACTSLRDLFLCSMGLKKVPPSVHHCTTLQRLDLSGNRIIDLADAALDQLPRLTILRLHANKLSRLPWYFVRMRSLRVLDIAHNRFTRLPPALCAISLLAHLDISFNAITELPDNLGELRKLERLVLVGNKLATFPSSMTRLTELRVLDVRRNRISDFALPSLLPNLLTLRVDRNAVQRTDLRFSSRLERLDLSHNGIVQITLPPGAFTTPFGLVQLDLAHAGLTSLDPSTFAAFPLLRTLRLDYNRLRELPGSIGELPQLIYFSCTHNALDILPLCMGRLRKLETLLLYGNSLVELPASLWNCASLMHFNASSNLITAWPDPPPPSPGFAVGSASASTPPPLAVSLERLYLGENHLTGDGLHPLLALRRLKVLNLAFNDLQDVPTLFFRNLTRLEVLHFGGNKLSSLPSEDISQLRALRVFYLNGNRFQTLPHELGSLKLLEVLDVGSNALRYNINNWEFDWNW